VCSARGSRCGGATSTTRSHAWTKSFKAGAPPFDALQATLIGAEALTLANRLSEAEARLASAADALDPRVAPAAWGEYLRLRGALHARTHGAADAYHDFSQSAALLDLLGERYQSALSHLALGRLVAETGARSVAERHLNRRSAIFQQLGAERDSTTPTPRSAADHDRHRRIRHLPADADDAIVRRIVDAAALPELLGRETAAALLEAAAGDCAVVFVELAGGDVRVVRVGGCEPKPRARWRDRRERQRLRPRRRSSSSRSAATGRPALRPGRLAAADRPSGDAAAADDRAVARQGFALCAARDRSVPVDRPGHRSLARAAHSWIPLRQRGDGPRRRADSAALWQRPDGADHRGSGTGKELVARAIHAGSHRSAGTTCRTTAPRPAAIWRTASLFGHRRGSFTGAVTDQPGLVRTAVGGTLFLTRSAISRSDVQPKLLRFLEQHEIMPIGESKPQRVDVRGPRRRRMRTSSSGWRKENSARTCTTA
jgi:hypothetical protein